jgi:hypothetical protein
MGKLVTRGSLMHVLTTSIVALRASLIAHRPSLTPYNRLPLLRLLVSIGSKIITTQFTQFLLIHRMNRIIIFDPKLFTSVPMHLWAQPLTT